MNLSSASRNQRTSKDKTGGDEAQPIRFGLFDSGIGGLSVLRQLHQLASVCPERNFEFVYLGDTARCPYGNRDSAQIQQFIGEIIKFLAHKGVDHVVMACNTSAAVGLEHARRVSPVPVHDIISPATRYAATNFHRVGVMATQSTANSKAFSQRIRYHAPDAFVFELGCPGLVPLVEAGDVYSEHAKAVLMEYTNQMEKQEVEAIILGCTHFPFLQKAIRDLLPASIALIDPAELLARQIISDLGLNIDEALLTEAVPEIYCGHSSKIYTTGSASVFASTAAVCLGRTDAALVAPGSVVAIDLEVISNSPAPQPNAETTVSNVVPLPPIKSALPKDSKIVQA
jgi:glutamate racemase